MGRSETAPLSAEQIEAFQQEGFVFVPGFYDPAAIKQMTGWVDEVTAWQEAPGHHMVYYEDNLAQPGGRVVQRIEDFAPYHQDFATQFESGRMASAVAQLFDQPACLFKEKINYKLPGGDGFKAHQDVQAGWGRYASYYVTALVSIDAATLENGCLEVAPGWHGKGLIGEEWKPLDESAFSDLTFVPYPTQPGDAMFFDSFAPHRSGRNLTDSPRRVLYVTYNKAAEGDHRRQYYADKRAAYPPDIEREAGKSYVFKV